MDIFVTISGAVIGIVSTIAAIWGLLSIPSAFPTVLAGWRNIRGKLHVVSITSELDADLVAIDELQSAHFSGDVADDVGAIYRSVADSRRGPPDITETRPYFIALALKFEDVVVGYLTAEYFQHTQTIFLWYLLVDHKRISVHADRQRGSLMLIERMIREADATGIPWCHVLTEVESAPADLLTAKSKMLLFNNAAQNLSRKFRRDVVKVYRLPIRYRQPLLHPEHISDATAHEVPAWLLYAPRANLKGLQIVDGRLNMSRELALELLDTLLIKSYQYNFRANPEYMPYAQTLLNELQSQLPERLVLEDNPRTLSPL